MSTTFRSLGVPEPIADALAAQGIVEPFPIQAATIPPALEGLDLCGKAPTGSGKTIAFGVPMVARVTRSAPKRPHGLVLAPTRELAIQVADALASIAGDLRVLAVYGGANIETQIKKLRGGVDIVVATPGRLLDLLDRKVCDLRDVSFAVVDEADRMADMGFLPDVRRILDQTRDDRQTVLFSATLDGAIDELVRRYQHDPVVHEFHGEPDGDISHHFWLAERPERLALLGQIVDRVGPTVVFCRTKHGSDRVARQLGKLGVTAVAIHGNRSQAQRERALEAFHRGEVRALVATDVAARGIHVEGVLGVVHFDLPGDPKDYIHRSGRTGRAGSAGTVVALLDSAQRKDAMKLKKGAGVETDLLAPDLAVLPEGPRPTRRAPRPPRSERDGAKGGTKAGPPSAAKPSTKASATDAAKAKTRSKPKPKWEDQADERPRADARSGRSASGRNASDRTGAGADRDGGARGAGRNARPGRAERAERAERSERSERSPRSERPERWEEPRRDGGSASRTNRAERRASQFTEAERAARAAENERREAQRAKAKAANRSSSTARPGGDRTLPGDVPGAAKVRPSGASRRKAKREALVASGETPGPAKKRRSGKPRPPAPGGRKRRP
jgi:superfamily II DNA/RNA helicase